MVDRPPQPADDDNINTQQRRPIWTRPRVVTVVLLLLAFWLACAFLIPSLLYPSLSDSDLTDVTLQQQVNWMRRRFRNSRLPSKRYKTPPALPCCRASAQCCSSSGQPSALA
jgi:hypothetical protein